ncbi:MAG: cupin domain-containing protein [Candidatus Scalinduaceae bacterium]
MNLIKLRERVQFNEQFRPQILCVSPDAKAPLICLEPGQEIPAHPSGTGIFYVLEGKGIMYLDDKEISLTKGKVVIAPEGAKRGIKGVERLVAVAVHIS